MKCCKQNKITTTRKLNIVSNRIRLDSINIVVSFSLLLNTYLVINCIQILKILKYSFPLFVSLYVFVFNSLTCLCGICIIIV